MATVELKLRPWQTPNYATLEQPPGLKQDGIKELPSIPLSELSQEALSSLAQEWLTTLYAKAGKAPDWTFNAKAGAA